MAIDPLQTLAQPEAIQIDKTPQENDALGKDAFMQLLVTQLKNQDPLDPMESREMISQLSELTGVERLAAIDQRLAALEVGTAGMANAQTSELVGKNVTATGTNLRLDTLGDASASFRLDGSAESVDVTIRDGSGRTIKTLELGARGVGQHEIVWDGTDDAGQRVGPGRYTVEYEARREGGATVPVDTTIQGRVDEVSYENGFAELVVGGSRLVLGDVVSISM